MVAFEKITSILIILIACMFLAAPITQARIDWGGGGEGGGGVGGGGGGGSGGGALPPLPANGHYTTDCPQALYSDSDPVNATISWPAQERNGPTVLITGNGHYAQMWVSTGQFWSASSSYGWPVQLLPPWNASIVDVHLTATIIAPTPYAAGHTSNYFFFYSLDGQKTWKGGNITTATASLFTYTTFSVNVTTDENWTPDMLLSTRLFVKLYTGDIWVYISGMSIDYVGLMYNWTTLDIHSPLPIPKWHNTTLGNLDLGGAFVGGIGTLSFVGLIITPVVGIILSRHSDNKPMLAVKAFAFWAACFCLFLGIIHF